MTPRTAYTSPGDDSTRRGRLAKAREFLESAEVLRDMGTEAGVFTAASPLADSVVSLCVLSGIASADALCIRRTGRYYKGSDHVAAVPVLAAATDRSTAKHLSALLQVKTLAEYDARSVDDRDIVEALGAAEALLAAATSG